MFYSLGTIYYITRNSKLSFFVLLTRDLLHHSQQQTQCLCFTHSGLATSLATANSVSKLLYSVSAIYYTQSTVLVPVRYIFSLCVCVCVCVVLFCFGVVTVVVVVVFVVIHNLSTFFSSFLSFQCQSTLSFFSYFFSFLLVFEGCGFVTSRYLGPFFLCMLSLYVVSVCCLCMLSLYVVSVCCLCMLSLYVVSVCCLCMLSQYVVSVCCLCMLSLYVVSVCCLCMLSLYVVSVCCLCMLSLCVVSAIS